MNAGGRRLRPQLARVATSDERQCFEGTVARLRESGRTEMGASEIAAEAGMTSIAVRKFLTAAGYRRVAEATWDASGAEGGDRSPQDV